MNKITSFLLLFFLFASCSSSRISKSDIRHAQRIFGVEFTATQIATMQEYLNSNLEGYDSMRLSPPENDVIPAMIFDPLPKGFEIKKHHSSFQFALHEAVTLPENPEDLAFYSVADLSVLIKQSRFRP